MQKRLTAVKTDIKSLVVGKYVRQEGFNPNYVLTPDGGKVSRVRVMANVVAKFISDTGKMGSITLDDGTETIRAKTFNRVDLIEGLELGDLVDVVGKVRVYNDELFINIESVYKVEDPNQEILRMVEVLKRPKKEEPIKEITKSDVLKVIEELDEGDGADYMDIIKCLDDEKSVEKVIDELLEDGTCFEPRPGKIKKL